VNILVSVFEELNFYLKLLALTFNLIHLFLRQFGD